MTTRVEISGDKLVLTVTGMDVVFSMRKHMEVPLSAVKSVAKGVTEDAKDKLADSIRVGTRLPGVITAGHYYEHGHWMFWNIGDGSKAITIGVEHGKYEYLVVDVEDQDGAVALIQGALKKG